MYTLIEIISLLTCLEYLDLLIVDIDFLIVIFLLLLFKQTLGRNGHWVVIIILK